ncbi:MAG: FG-GAP-like repeat-containing protein [Candidatus Eisenbacteria bacterium]
MQTRLFPLRIGPNRVRLHALQERANWNRDSISTGCACVALTLALASWASDAQAFTFSQVTDASNPIVADGGHGGSRYYGCAWVDFDGDDDLDLFLDLDTLYENQGGGQFVRREDTGLGDGQIASPGFSMSGVSWGDYDNDGDPDAFIAGEASYLYRNDGLSGFTRITTGAIGGGTDNRGWTCAWGDYDNDGHLDLVIIHPAGFVPPGDMPLENKLFHNDGPPNYSFTEITTGPIVTGLDSYTVGTWSDHDDDGDLDFFIGSGPADGTTQPDNVYRNLLTETGTANFERILDAPIGTDEQDGQVWNWIDYDNDGDLDAYVTNWGGGFGGLPNRLYRQETDGSFTEITGQEITDDARVSLASIWEDFDNDGDLDCYVGNDGSQLDGLYENNGDGTFTKITDTPITNEARARRGATAGDYDGDGDVDLLVNGPNLSRALYRNDDASGNGWLDVSVFGTLSNRSAIGAKIHLKATIGGNAVWQRREISGQNSFNGHSAQIAHFGLGDATFADSVVVEFPSGEVATQTNVAANQKIVIGEGDLSSTPPNGIAPSEGARLVLLGPSPFRAATQIRLDLPNTEAAEVTVHDVQGRLVRTLLKGQVEAGSQTLSWNGKDDLNRSVSSGVYSLRLRTPEGQSSQSLVYVR